MCGESYGINILRYIECDDCGYTEFIKDSHAETNQDTINPTHYQQGKYEIFDVIQDITEHLPQGHGFFVGNVIKYIARYPNKNGIEDVKKAKRNLEQLIKVMEEQA